MISVMVHCSNKTTMILSTASSFAPHTSSSSLRRFINMKRKIYKATYFFCVLFVITLECRSVVSFVVLCTTNKVVTISMKQQQQHHHRHLQHRRNVRRQDQPLSFKSQKRSFVVETNNNEEERQLEESLQPFPTDLIRALDLYPIMIVLSNNAATKRGQQAILRLVSGDEEIESSKRGNEEIYYKNDNSINDGKSRRKMILEQMSLTKTTSFITDAKNDTTSTISDYANDWISSYSVKHSQDQALFHVKVASNASEARYQYELVEQAMFAISNNYNTQYNVTCPPFFFPNDDDDDVTENNNRNNNDYDKSKVIRSDARVVGKINNNNKRKDNIWSHAIKKKLLNDYDEWMFLPPNQWTLEHILQAEKLIDMIIQINDWAQEEDTTMTWMPLLSQIVRLTETSKHILESIVSGIKNTVEIVRVRTIMDPSGRSSYVFRLSEQKYPILGILRQKQGNIQDQINQKQKQSHSNNNNNKVSQRLQQDLISIEQEIESKQQDITWGLIVKVYEHLDIINVAFNNVAELDVGFAKAKFGIDFNGKIPQQQNRLISSSLNNICSIHVPNFIHPLLLIQNNGLTNQDGHFTNKLDMKTTGAVPIDLHLSEKIGEHALIISGSNGGGKTLALKSFGLVAVFGKLGIPIPTYQPNRARETIIDRLSTDTKNNIVVDYFDRILTSLGDQQDLDQGESTYTGQLKKYSSIIDIVSVSSTRSSSLTTLVLLDELGSGTEASVGSAIGQAVLEKLLETESCRIVATTHSSRIKSLSFHNDSFRCAAVLLSELDDIVENNHYHIDSNPHSLGQSSTIIHAKKTVEDTLLLSRRHRHPSFRLEYDIIGESSGLEAASRCSSPPFPADVLHRVSELLQMKTSEAGQDSPVSAQSIRLPAFIGDNIQNATDHKLPIEQQKSGYATATVEHNDISLEYNVALTQSRKKILELTELAQRSAEADSHRIAAIQKAIFFLATSYEKHWAQLEHRIEMCYDELKNPPGNGMIVELVGSTLSELRTVRRQAKSVAEVLKEKGLKSIIDSYNLKEGEMVVILADVLDFDESENLPLQEEGMDGTENFATGTVASRDLLSLEEQGNLRPDDVVVLPSSSLYLGGSLIPETGMIGSIKPVVLKRYQLAVWDYDSVWDEFKDVSSAFSTSSTSLRDSKRRFHEILKNLKKPKATSSNEKSSSSNNPEVIRAVTNNQQTTFSSSRERKASQKRQRDNDNRKRKR